MPQTNRTIPKGETVFNTDSNQYPNTYSIYGGLSITKGQFGNSGDIYVYDTGYINVAEGTEFTTLELGTLENYGKIYTSGYFAFNTPNTSGRFKNGMKGTVYIREKGVLGNNGKILNESLATIEINGEFDNSGVGSIINNGTILNKTKDASKFHNGGILTGNGSIVGSWTDHGQVHPGNSTGGMLFNGDYFKSDGNISIEINGDDDRNRDRTKTTYDFIDVSGDMIISGGMLDVSLIDDYKLRRGQEFLIAKIDGKLSGEFDKTKEGQSLGEFESIYGKKINLFISYEAGDGNDISLYTPPLINSDMIFA